MNLDKRNLTLKDICILQDKLNSHASLHTSPWKETLKKEDFILAASLEFAELIESTSWKWWKKANTINLWNLKIEAIDMLHFMASAIILKGGDIEENITLGHKDDEYNATLFTNQKDTSSPINRTYATSLMLRLHTDIDDVKTLQDVMLSVGLRKSEISAIYIAKYTLNEIRWQNGYKDGSYKKMKNNIEDNEFLQDIVNTFLAKETMTLSDVKKEVYQLLG